jgi:hypothetical protein
MWWAAVAGAAISQISGAIQSGEEQDRLREQKRKEGLAFRQQQRYRDEMFALQRTRALDELDDRRNRLGEALGADIAGINLGIESRAADTQDARISLAGNAGMARAAEGASGTRGSGGTERNIAYQEAALARRTDLQRRGDSLLIGNTARQYTNEFNDLGREKDSWDAGGYRAMAHSVEDRYALEQHQARAGEIDRAIDDAAFTFGDFLYAGLTGAAQGAGFGQQLKGLSEQMPKGSGQAAPAGPATDKTTGAIRYYDELFKK